MNLRELGIWFLWGLATLPVALALTCVLLIAHVWAAAIA